MKTLALLLALLIHLVATAQPAAPPSAVSSAIPADEPGFLNHLVGRLQQVLPDYQFRISGQSLWGQRSDGEPLGQLDPMPTYRSCQDRPDLCKSAVDQYATTVRELALTRRQPGTLAQLRLTLRPSSFVDQVRQQTGTDGPARIHARTVLPGVVMVPVLDFQNSLRFVGAAELRQLGLTEERLFETARHNTQSALLPLSVIARRPAGGNFGFIDAEDFAASRVLEHADWSDLAAQYHQQLAVMLPTPNFVLYGDAANPLQLAVMRREGQKIYQRSARPLSLDLLRWTPTGWERMPPKAGMISPSDASPR
ncbi:MAG: hypothetical protein RLY71_2987 [Pseudomonadota bacterium]|jgi:hypothetical protein